MKISIKNVKVEIEGVYIITLVIYVLSTYAREFLNNYYMCFLFITFHEFAHLSIATLFGYCINKINIRLSGISISINPTISKGALLIYLAGPLSNVLLAIMFRNIKFVKEINIVLALINMVPIFPLDGYNILKVLLDNCKIKKIEEKMQNIAKNIMVIVGIVAIYILIKYKNPSLFFMLIYIVFLNIKNSKLT